MIPNQKFTVTCNQIISKSILKNHFKKFTAKKLSGTEEPFNIFDVTHLAASINESVYTAYEDLTLSLWRIK